MAPPFSLGAYASRANTERLTRMRADLGDLQRQLATEKRADSYAGLGDARRASLDGRGRLAALDAFGDTITDATLRIKTLDQSVSQLSKIAISTRADLRSGAYTIGGDGLTIAQKSAEGNLQFALDILNAKLGDRYLFSGRTSDVRPALDADAILNGDGGRAGLKQLIAERRAADLGAPPQGRTTLASAGATITLAEEAAGLPFGLKLAAAASTLTGATVAGPAGSPSAVTVTVAGQPNAGETLRVSLNLPDGSTEDVVLTAQTSVTTASPKGSFAIGATPAATQANLQAALGAALGEVGATSLSAASAAVAAREFFAGSANAVPQRVAGPPFASATGFTPGTAADTIVWYEGDDRFPVTAGNPGPRATVLASVETNQSVPVGAQANEPGFRNLLAQLATLASSSFAPNDELERARYEAMTLRLRDGLAGPPGAASVEDINSEIAVASVAVGRAEGRRKAQASLLQTAVDTAENADKTQVATSLLALQTRLEASYQTTATLSRMSLVNYLGG